MDEHEHDQNVMGCGIHLSEVVRWFLTQNKTKLDQIAELGLISRHDLEALRSAQEVMKQARIERLEAARAS